MSDERNNLGVVSSPTQPVYDQATGQFRQVPRPDTLAPLDPNRNALMPSTGIPGNVFSPLFPNQTPPTTPLGPTGAPGRWGLVTPDVRPGKDWADEQLQLRQRVSRMMNDMPDALRGQVHVESGFRTHEQQAELWQQHLRGEIGRTAQPGSSLHEQGLAADWHFDTPAAKAWMYNNASRYGLAFPFADDDGHMQTLERTGTLSPEARTGAILPWVPAQYRQPILDAGFANGIDPRLLASMVQQESSFNPKSGPQIGLGQLTPDTAKDMGVNPYDINDNLMGAARRLRQMYDDPRVQGDARKALMLYNSGPGGSFQNPQYADAVLQHYQQGTGQQYVQAAQYQFPFPGTTTAQMTPSRPIPGPQLAQAGVPDIPGGSGPSGEPKQGQPGQQLPGLSQSGMPQALTSGQMMALMFSMSAQRVQARPVSYDPWSIERAAIGGTNTRFPMSAQQMSPVGGLGLSPYTTRIGRTVPGPA